MAKGYACQVVAWWTSGFTGLAQSPSAPNALHFTAPAEFGGVDGRWTPEELLLAGIAGCFTTTLRSLAERAGLEFVDLEVEATGRIGKTESGHRFSEILVRPSLRIASFAEREHALDLLNRAKEICPVAEAFAIPLKFEPQLEVVPATCCNR
jgi:organic hydroperoxide reductase OsmC/OhrA